MDQEATLIDADRGIGLGGAAYGRHVVAPLVGQHAFVAGHAHAAKRNRIEVPPIGRCLAQQQLGFPGRDAGHRVQPAPLIARAFSRSPSHRAIVPHAPRGDVQPGAQAQVASVVGTSAAHVLRIVVAGIAQPRGSDATVRQGRIHIDAGASRTQVDGGHGQQQLLFRRVEPGLCAGNMGSQIAAIGRVSQRRTPLLGSLALKLFHVEPRTAQQFDGVARRRAILADVAEFHERGPAPVSVHQHIDAILTRQHGVRLFEPGEIDGIVRDAAQQHIGIELHVLLGFTLRLRIRHNDQHAKARYPDPPLPRLAPVSRTSRHLHRQMHRSSLAKKWSLQKRPSGQ